MFHQIFDMLNIYHKIILLLKLLALSENSIIKFKQNKNKADLNDREMNLKNLKMR